MVKEKDDLDRENEKNKRKRKDECCEKYLKKGKHCKDCPLVERDRQPE